MNKSQRHIIRTSTYDELLERNKSKPENIKRIKNNLIEILAILFNGLGITIISNYCRITQKEPCHQAYIMIIYIL